MLNITIVGAGSYGARIADKYAHHTGARLKAVVSRRKPRSGVLAEVTFAASAKAWRGQFGKPNAQDIFDLCVHHPILANMLTDFAAIGAKNFIVPKPVALTRDDLTQIESLVRKHKLNVYVASQWHYATLTQNIARFVAKNKTRIVRAELEFSRPMEPEQRTHYTPETALLPHMLQILADTKLIGARSRPTITENSDNAIAVRYAGKIDVAARSHLKQSPRTERLRIYFAGEKTPALTANFDGVARRAGFTTSLKVGGKTRKIRDDILDSMLTPTLAAFAGKNRRALSVARYLPVALQQVRIAEEVARTVGVIGGGIFGALAALEIARKGFSVVLLERSTQIIMGASLVNQYRVHMGYHYPRDDKTAQETNEAKRQFEKMFGPAIVRGLTNHYLVAKEGSLTSAAKFKAFCKRIGLPHTESWPPGIPFVRDMIDLSVGVPEQIFDANVLRRLLMERIAAEPRITLVTNADVSAVKRTGSGFEIAYGMQKLRTAAVVNATYSNINVLNKSLGVPLHTYQYELCEMPVARTPWGRAGWSVIDGPFFGVMPYGFANDYLLYDVELSVLERTIGALPKFKRDIAYYDDPDRRMKRFKGYLRKWKPFIPNVDECRYLRSMYMARVVLPYQDKTDTRVTIVEEPTPGFWHIFSGKISRSVITAPEVAAKVAAFLR